MTDILVRGVPEEDAVRIAANAARQGVSQAEYLRRILHAAASSEAAPLSSLAGSASGLFPAGILDALDAEWER